MFPTLLQLGPIKLHMYGLMIAIGFLLTLYLIQRDGKKLKLNPDDITSMAFGVLIWGVLGTRLLHIIMYPENYSWSDPLGWIAIWNGGLVFQGALPAAILYAWWALRRRGIPFWIMPDIVMPYVALAQAFGRMGCFFNGCCYGQRADALPWALQFPPTSPPGMTHHSMYHELGAADWSYPVHPTQIYSVILLLSICGILLLMRRYWRPFIGFCFPMYFILYGIKRFIVESFRGDGNPTNLGLGVLSNQQVFCVVFVLVGAALFAYLYRNPPKPVWAPPEPAKDTPKNKK